MQFSDNSNDHPQRGRFQNLKAFLRRFSDNERGSSTVDMVVLIAASVGLALAAFMVYSGGMEALTDDRVTAVTGYQGMGSSSTVPVSSP